MTQTSHDLRTQTLAIVSATQPANQPAAEPVKLIVPMLERFISTDRGFAKARRQTTNRQLNDRE